MSPNSRVQDVVNSLVVDGNDDVIAGGVLFSDNYDTENFTVLKLAGPTGDLLWERFLAVREHDYSRAYSVTLDQRGDVIAAGHSEEGTGLNSTVKISGQDGEVLWRSSLSSPSGGTAYSADTSSSGTVLVVGTTGSMPNQVAQALDDANGAELWRHRISDDVGRLIGTESSGGFFVGGIAVERIDEGSGVPLWSTPLGFGGIPAHAFSMVGSPEGDVVVAAAGFPGGIPSQPVLFKLGGSTGDVLWSRLSPWSSAPFCLLCLPGRMQVISTGRSGNIFAVEFSGFGNVEKFQAMTGDLMWTRNPLGPGARLRALSLNGTGDVFAVGTRLGDSPDGIVVKLSGRTGLDWQADAMALARDLQIFLEGLDPARSRPGLEAKLRAAITRLGENSSPHSAEVVANTLTAFMNEVQAQEGKNLSVQDAEDLIDGANEILLALTNP